MSDKKSNVDEHIARTKYTYEQIHDEYVEHNTELKQEIKVLLDRFIELVPGKDVLDVGCAGGRESKYLLQHDFKVTGVDIGESFIQTAQQNCPGGTFFVADMRHLDFPPGSFDGLWINASFLHVPKVEAVDTLKGFYKLLKPGGLAFISVMGGDFDDLRPNEQNNWPDRHFSDYQQQELEAKLADAGFAVVESSSQATTWGPTFLRYYVKK
jgi:2-polyprenyl-3-methyl-5-hydroxy-6-metoxy-1,4-benzoquinol methylase